jgi:hypothetical protein
VCGVNEFGISKKKISRNENLIQSIKTNNNVENFSSEMKKYAK